ncbi:MAG: EF-hand domain-containing protein [Vitreoscilla sp.]
MKVIAQKLLSVLSTAAVVCVFALPAHAQGSRNEDRLRHFQMSMIDTNKDGFVSKKEFVDTMSRMWDMEMSDMAKSSGGDAMKAAPAKMKDRMTIEQYREFAKMFGLDIGG